MIVRVTKISTRQCQETWEFEDLSDHEAIERAVIGTFEPNESTEIEDSSYSIFVEHPEEDTDND